MHHPTFRLAALAAALTLLAACGQQDAPAPAVSAPAASPASGGVLLQTPLLNPLTGQAHVMAQGPVSTGTIAASSLGSSARTGPTNTGRVPGGGLVVAAPTATLPDGSLGLVLKQPDFTTASAIAEAVNGAGASAAVVHAGLVRLDVSGVQGGTAGAMALIEGLRVEVDVPARVVINERTGTIVAGGNVRISEVMVTYGSLVISTQVDPFVSQPNALGAGETVAGAAGRASIRRALGVAAPLTPVPPTAPRPPRASRPPGGPAWRPAAGRPARPRPGGRRARRSSGPG